MNDNVLNKTQLADIKLCGRFLCETMNIVKAKIKVGISTKELDQIAEAELRKRGTIPAFLDYHVEGSGRYPASLCVSINDEIVHGIPSHRRYIKEGDIVSLDLGAGYRGVYTDMAVTVAVGQIDQEIEKLIKITERSLYLGIDQAVSNNTIGDIGNAIEKFVLSNNLEVIRDYVGHGIGTHPHMWPQIPNFGTKGKGPKLVESMALAIEPMVTFGDSSTRVHSDNWTVLTKNGRPAAHFEHTVIIENGKPVIVTKC